VQRAHAARALKAILKRPWTLLYNGGIGTYVKAAAQRNAEVGDRANDRDPRERRGAALQGRAEGGNLGSRSSAASSTRRSGGPASTPTRSTTRPAWTAPTTR
jgi:glutamate dehydrogenase